MRFVNGSHREGPLGRTYHEEGMPDVFEKYPDLLDRYRLSEPLHLRPGDATAHSGLVVHGAPENTTDEARWAFIASYFPADTLYTGAPFHNFDGRGLEVNKPFDLPITPIVYP